MELTIDEALRQGIAAHKDGKIQEADRLYTAILGVQPKHPDVVSHGDFYASTVVDRLGLAKEGGLIRAGAACYTTDEEVQRLLTGVTQLARRA